MSEDYGFYGKGFEGYGHYMTAINSNKNGGGGGGGKPSSGGDFSVWPIVILLISIVFVIIKLLIG